MDTKVPELIDKWISCSLTNYKDEKSDEKEENPDDQQEKIDERQENLEEEQENPKEKEKKLDEKLNNLVKEVTARPHGTRPHGTLFSQIHYFGLGTKISKIHCFLSSLITSRYTISRNV